ncbi:hypothetical protein CMI46_02830 [Candidatus Pacearchaeota archaeon]|nr:hypothetical protein [Candidatus Pacearchaeota archaeon]
MKKGVKYLIGLAVILLVVFMIYSSFGGVNSTGNTIFVDQDDRYDLDNFINYGRGYTRFSFPEGSGQQFQMFSDEINLQHKWVKFSLKDLNTGEEQTNIRLYVGEETRVEIGDLNILLKSVELERANVPFAVFSIS